MFLLIQAFNLYEVAGYLQPICCHESSILAQLAIVWSEKSFTSFACNHHPRHGQKVWEPTAFDYISGEHIAEGLETGKRENSPFIHRNQKVCNAIICKLQAKSCNYYLHELYLQCKRSSWFDQKICVFKLFEDGCRRSEN